MHEKAADIFSSFQAFQQRFVEKKEWAALADERLSAVERVLESYGVDATIDELQRALALGKNGGTSKLLRNDVQIIEAVWQPVIVERNDFIVPFFAKKICLDGKLSVPFLRTLAVSQALELFSGLGMFIPTYAHYALVGQILHILLSFLFVCTASPGLVKHFMSGFEFFFFCGNTLITTIFGYFLFQDGTNRNALWIIYLSLQGHSIAASQRRSFFVHYVSDSFHRKEFVSGACHSLTRIA